MPVIPPLRRPRQKITAHLGLPSEASLRQCTVQFRTTVTEHSSSVTPQPFGQGHMPNLSSALILSQICLETGLDSVEPAWSFSRPSAYPSTISCINNGKLKMSPRSRASNLTSGLHPPRCCLGLLDSPRHLRHSPSVQS